MSKRTHFTTVTPLPAGITRETVMSTLHCHTEMIDLNPLVIERHPIRPPPQATPEEAHCQWYSITDKMKWLPGVKGTLNFTACFNDLEDGLQTRILAPLGLEMAGRWTLGGSLPGEKIKKQEINLGMPKSGLYLREDVDMKVNFTMTSFVKKNTVTAHRTLVDRLIEKSHIKETDTYNSALNEQIELREQYPPDYHSGIMSPSASTVGRSSSVPNGYGRESVYSTAPSTMAPGSDSGDTASVYSQRPQSPPNQQPQQNIYSQHNPPHPQAPVGYPPAHYLPQQQQHLYQQYPPAYPPDHKHTYQPQPQHQPQPGAHPHVQPQYHPSQTPLPHPQLAQHPALQQQHQQQQPQHKALKPHQLQTNHLATPPPHNFAVELPSQGDRTPAELGP